LCRAIYNDEDIFAKPSPDFQKRKKDFFDKLSSISKKRVRDVHTALAEYKKPDKK